MGGFLRRVMLIGVSHHISEHSNKGDGYHRITPKSSSSYYYYYNYYFYYYHYYY